MTRPASLAPSFALLLAGIAGGTPAMARGPTPAPGSAIAAFSAGGIDLPAPLRARDAPRASRPVLRWMIPGGRSVTPRPSASRGGPSLDFPWRARRMPSTTSMRFADVVPGVSLSWDAGARLTYRFDAAPHANIDAIRIRYRGATRIDIPRDGRTLRVHAGDATLTERGLTCFQMFPDGRREVPCRYKLLREDTVALAVGRYDPARALVIDPEIGWSSYLGGTNADHGRSVAIAPSGDVFVAGFTYSSDFPAAGGFDTSLDGPSDAFVAKVDAAGAALLWSSYLGGSDDEQAHGVAVDAAGDAYVAGYTASSDFPASGGFDATHAGVEDAFVAKVDDTGALLWASYLGGSQPDQADGVVIDAGGAAVVVGHTLSPDFPISSGFDSQLDGGDDGFVTRVFPGGGLDWSSFLGGDSDDWAYAVAADAAGSVYVTGYTISADFPSSGGFDPMGGGGVEDAFVTKLDTSGPTITWSSYLGGSAPERGLAIAVDGAGEVYVSGQTASTSFPAAGGFDSALGGILDAFVARVDASGALLTWSSYLGGAGVDYGYAIAVDASGVPHIAGRSHSADFPSGGGFDTALSGSADGFVAQLDVAGAGTTWSSYLGGSGSDHATAIAVGTGSNLALTGETLSDDFPTVGGFTTARPGGYDAWVTRVVACGSGVCEPGETQCNCPADCGADVCLNGCCGPGETTCNCGDCTIDVCGDGCCGSTETACSCEADCGADTCGNGCCGAAETECTCAQDCAVVCGDTCCGTTETACSCDVDCGADACGNGCCGATETACTCPADCGADECDNGCCGAEETACTCPADCGADECDNGCCGPEEDANSCPYDCPDECGDLFCRGSEDCMSCQVDCGACEEPVESVDNADCGCTIGGAPNAAGTTAPWALSMAPLALAVFSRRSRRRRSCG